eukprot:355813-Chlamydomonas_euryale.AAC.3
MGRCAPHPAFHTIRWARARSPSQPWIADGQVCGEGSGAGCIPTKVGHTTPHTSVVRRHESLPHHTTPHTTPQPTFVRRRGLRDEPLTHDTMPTLPVLLFAIRGPPTIARTASSCTAATSP